MGTAATQLAPLMIVEAGATSTLAIRSLFDTHCVWLKSLKLDIPKMNPADMTFRFGDGNTLPAMGRSFLPCCFQVKRVGLCATVIDAPRPALL